MLVDGGIVKKDGIDRSVFHSYELRANSIRDEEKKKQFIGSVQYLYRAVC